MISCGATPVPPTQTSLPTITATSTPAVPTKIPTESQPSTVEQIDISNPESFRTEKWDYLISPEYLKELQNKEKEGLLPSVPENPSYIKPGFMHLNFEGKPSGILKDYGQDPIFTLSNQSVYSNIDKRPYVFADIVNTELFGIKMIFLVNKWENSDGTSGFTGHFVPNYSLLRKIGINTALGNISKGYITGGFFAKTNKVDGCLGSLKAWGVPAGTIPTFCEYYYNNQNKFLPKEIYINWKDSGNLVNTDSLPISIANGPTIQR